MSKHSYEIQFTIRGTIVVNGSDIEDAKDNLLYMSKYELLNLAETEEPEIDKVTEV